MIVPVGKNASLAAELQKGQNTASQLYHYNCIAKVGPSGIVLSKTHGINSFWRLPPIEWGDSSRFSGYNGRNS